jgi:hypothetical protein
MAKSSETDRARQRLIQRAQEDPFFLGSALAAYCSSHQLTAESLAAWLECSAPDLERLALCRLPNDGKGRFRDDVERIAAFGPCSPIRLATLLRETSALTALKGDSHAYELSSLLLVARDRRRPAKKRKRK